MVQYIASLPGSTESDEKLGNGLGTRLMIWHRHIENLKCPSSFRGRYIIFLAEFVCTFNFQLNYCQVEALAAPHHRPGGHQSETSPDECRCVCVS